MKIFLMIDENSKPYGFTPYGHLAHKWAKEQSICKELSFDQNSTWYVTKDKKLIKVIEIEEIKEFY